MKKAFGAILIAVILIVCVVTLTVQRGENAMLEFPERPAEGCTVMSLEITDGKAQTEVIGTYNVNENVLTMNTSALENAEPAESGENYTYTLPESIPNFYFSDTTQGLLLYKGYLYVVTATTSGQTLEIINLKTGTLGGKIYYSQISSDGTSVIVCRAAGPGQDARAEYMTLKYFGHGTQIVAEEASDGKTYIWLNSNASVDSSGEYGDNWSVSRVEFVPGALSEAGYAGETFFLNKDGQYDQQVAIDFPARRLLVGSRKSGVRYFWIFDLDEALALPLKTMTATVTVGSAGSDPVTREIRARDLNDCRVLGSFSVPAGSDKENDVYSYSHQGHEVAGNYVYFYEGNAVETGADSFASKAYVTVFNYSGKIVVPRTEVAAVADAAGLAAAGLTTTGYAEGESLKVRDGKLYLGVACRDGSSSNRRANILVYDCVQAE